MTLILTVFDIFPLLASIVKNASSYNRPRPKKIIANYNTFEQIQAVKKHEKLSIVHIFHA